MSSVIFFLAVFLVIGRINVGEALIYTGILVSPAIMLAVERGNNDLLIFGLVSLASILLSRRQVGMYAGASGLLLFASILKIYPVFASLVFLRRERKRALIGLGLILVPLTLYLLATAEDLRLLSEATPRPIFHAYGVGVIVDLVRQRLLGEGFFSGLQILLEPGAGMVLYGLAVAIPLLLSFRLVRSITFPIKEQQPGEPPRILDMFWAGAGIYLRTFVFVGHN